MTQSLRLRLLIGIAFTTSLVFSVSGIATFVLLRRSLVEEFDALLGAKVRALATLVEQTDAGIEIEFHEHPMQEFARQVRPEYYQLWDSKQRVLSRSRRLAAEDLLPIGGSLNSPAFRSATLPDGRPGRQASATFYPAIEEESLALQRLADQEAEDHHDQDDADSGPGHRATVTIAVARETASVDAALAQLRTMLVVVFGSALLCLLLALAWLVGISLRPLRDLSHQLANVDENQLAYRFDSRRAPFELAPVAERLNDLMQRLESAFERERSWTANMAHELRTPLAGIRSTLDVALRRPRSSQEYRETLANCSDICTGMQRLVVTLLALARIESGNAALDRRPTEVKRLVTDTWQEFAESAAARDLSVHQTGPNDVMLETDASQLRMVLCNLFTNATEYTNSPGQIDIDWWNDHQRVVITVSNSRCEFDDDSTDQCFERFWRGDSARADTGSHAGLGLALCRKIVHAMAGSIQATIDSGRFSVMIELPRFGAEIPSARQGRPCPASAAATATATANAEIISSREKAAVLHK